MWHLQYNLYNIDRSIRIVLRVIMQNVTIIQLLLFYSAHPLPTTDVAQTSASCLRSLAHDLITGGTKSIPHKIVNSFFYLSEWLTVPSLTIIGDFLNAFPLTFSECLCFFYTFSECLSLDHTFSECLLLFFSQLSLNGRFSLGKPDFLNALPWFFPGFLGNIVRTTSRIDSSCFVILSQWLKLFTNCIFGSPVLLWSHLK